MIVADATSVHDDGALLVVTFELPYGEPVDVGLLATPAAVLMLQLAEVLREVVDCDADRRRRA